MVRRGVTAADCSSCQCPWPPEAVCECRSQPGRRTASGQRLTLTNIGRVCISSAGLVGAAVLLHSVVGGWISRIILHLLDRGWGRGDVCVGNSRGCFSVRRGRVLRCCWLQGQQQQQQKTEQGHWHDQGVWCCPHPSCDLQGQGLAVPKRVSIQWWCRLGSRLCVLALNAGGRSAAGRVRLGLCSPQPPKRRTHTNKGQCGLPAAQCLVPDCQSCSLNPPCVPQCRTSLADRAQRSRRCPVERHTGSLPGRLAGSDRP